MAKKKKKRPFKHNRFKRAIRQQAYLLFPEDEAVFEELAERVRNARNYMYSRLAGINSYLRLYKTYDIRDEWVKDKKLIEQFKLPARFWKITLEEVIGNIKSLWSNTINKIKEASKENSNLTEDEKFYIRYVCSVPSLFGSILTRDSFKRPKKIETLDIREHYIHNLICRYARRYRGKTPYSYSKTFQIDANMYEYIKEENEVHIDISTHEKRVRKRLKCYDQNIYKKNIRINFQGSHFTLAHTVESKEKKIWQKKNEIGVDKGYKTLLVSSNGNHYGDNLNQFLSKETERLNKVNQKRNPYYAMVRTLESKGEFEKAERIRSNNLGKKKYNRNKQKHDSTVKSYINKELNCLIRTEKPSKIGIENLAFVSWDKKMPKHIKRKLARWIKGYIDERLCFKCNLNGIEYNYVNSAYTSKECHVCGSLGERKTQEKFICKTCGEFHADENAAKVIKKRLNDKEITLYTPFKKVKEILQNRKKAVPVLN